MRKNLPFYCGVALRCIALTFILSTMADPARSETVPVEPATATATVQSSGAWFFQDYLSIHFPSGIASLFNGYPTGQAACDVYDAWIKSRNVPSGPLAHAPYTFFLAPGYTASGICVPYNSYSEWLATGSATFGMYYYQHCPTGYSTNDPRIRSVSSATFTCTNNGTAKQCPEVAEGETPFTLDPGGLTCSRCPVNSSGTFPDACRCNAGYEPDPTKTSCVSKCPVPALTAPPFNDACSQALENLSSTQSQKDAACGSLTTAMLTGKACLESKLAAMTPAAIPFVMTGNIRSVAYQAHLRDIWDKMQDLVTLIKKDPTKQTVCAARRAEIAAEKGCDNAGPCTSCYAESTTQRSHCLNGRPALPNPNDAQHTQGNAIDVSRTRTVIPLQASLAARRPPDNVQQFLDASSLAYPNGCNLYWGGTFTNNPDPVHFYAR